MKTLSLAVAACAALLVGTPAPAGDCYARPRTYYAPSYSYYTPSYSYTPTYYAPPAYYETKIKAVPYPVTVDYYSSVSDYYRDKLLVDAIAGKTADVLKKQQEEQAKDRELQILKEEVQLLRQRILYGGGGTSQPPPPPPPSQPPPRPEPPPPAKTPPKRTSALHPVPPKLGALVQQHCLRCHGESFARTGDGIDLRDLSAVDSETRRAAAQAVEDGTMPKGGKNLSDTDYQEFRAWATGRRAALAQK